MNLISIYALITDSSNKTNAFASYICITVLHVRAHREGGREEYLDKFLGQARCSMQHQKYTFLRTQGMQILRMEALRISKAEIVEFAN